MCVYIYMLDTVCLGYIYHILFIRLYIYPYMYLATQQNEVSLCSRFLCWPIGGGKRKTKQIHRQREKNTRGFVSSFPIRSLRSRAKVLKM